MDIKRYLYAGSLNKKGEKLIQFLNRSQTSVPLDLQTRDIAANTASVFLMPIYAYPTEEVDLKKYNKESK